MNIYLVVLLIIYGFFLAAFPIANKFFGWFDIGLGTLYLGEFLGLINLYVIFFVAKLVKLNIRGRYGEGIVKGILHSSETVSFAGRQNLLFAGADILFYNAQSETFWSSVLNKSDKDPYAHYKTLKEISLFAKNIFFNYGGEEIPFDRQFKSLMLNNGVNHSEVSTFTLEEMHALAQSKMLENVTESDIRNCAKYTENAIVQTNHDTKFAIRGSYVVSDGEEDIVIGLDRDFRIDSGTFTQKIEPNYKSTYWKKGLFVIVSPLLWILFVAMVLLGDGNDFISWAEIVQLYLYSTFLQIPFYYLVGWKYVTLFNRTAL